MNLILLQLYFKWNCMNNIASVCLYFGLKVQALAMLTQLTNAFFSYFAAFLDMLLIIRPWRCGILY